MNSNEVWKSIPGLEGEYEASTLGRIRSVQRIVRRGKGTQFIKGKILSTPLSNYGYPRVNVHRAELVHRLVALTFLGPSELHVDHINGDRADNRVVNLRYCTQHENNLYCHARLKGRAIVGVSKLAKGSKWVAALRINGRCTNLGHFDTKEKAFAVYRETYEKTTGRPLPNLVNESPIA